MATFVLVQGACGGGWSWKKLAPLLRAAGHEVYTPTLTGLGERVHLGHPDVDLDTHITDIVNVLEYEDLQDVVLVGWSYGGMVITGVADRVPERLAHLVYLDATVPQHGQNRYGRWPDSDAWRAEDDARARAIGDGWRHYYPDEALDMMTDLTAVDRSWFLEKRTGQPLKTVTQPLRLHRTPEPQLSRTYIYCSVGVDPSEPEPAFLHRARTESGWRYLVLPASLWPQSQPRGRRPTCSCPCCRPRVQQRRNTAISGFATGCKAPRTPSGNLPLTLSLPGVKSRRRCWSPAVTPMVARLRTELRPC